MVRPEPVGLPDQRQGGTVVAPLVMDNAEEMVGVRIIRITGQDPAIQLFRCRQFTLPVGRPGPLNQSVLRHTLLSRAHTLCRQPRRIR